MRLGTLSFVPWVFALMVTSAEPRSGDEDSERSGVEAANAPARDPERTDEGVERPASRDSDPAPDSFTPSERIPADTVVPFPADI